MESKDRTLDGRTNEWKKWMVRWIDDEWMEQKMCGQMDRQTNE